MDVCQCNPKTRMGISGIWFFCSAVKGGVTFTTQSVVKKRHTALALCDVK